MVMSQLNIQNSSDNDWNQKRLPVRLEHDRVIYGVGTRSMSVSLWDISCIRFCTSGLGRLCLTLEAIDGRSIALRWNAKNADESGFFTLAVKLLTRVSQRNQFVTLSIGPSPKAWIIAWLGFVTSIVIIIGMTWAALSGQGVPTPMLPLALSPFSLFFIVPILLNGPNRTVGLQQLVNALAEHDPALNRIT